MSVLEKIISNRRKNLPDREQLAGMEIPLKNKGVVEQLRRADGKRLNLIAEIKRQSPSKGVINQGMSVEKALAIYDRYASAISVLTEPDFFGGSIDDLKVASSLTQKPLLRKDFIIDPIQVKEAAVYGADFYLLIVAALSNNQLDELLDAGRELGMPALVEIHTAQELETALGFGEKLEILGINNRSLLDLSIDLETTQRLSRLIPEAQSDRLVLVTESGLGSRIDLEKVSMGIDCALIGTAFMKSGEPEKLLEEMFGE